MSRSAIAVIRISGPNSLDVVQKMTKIRSESITPRKAVLSKILDPRNGELLDSGIVLWFPQPNSFTGEDSVELHIHGGIAVLSSIMNALQSLPGFRAAEAGIALIPFKVIGLQSVDLSILRRIHQKSLHGRKT